VEVCKIDQTIPRSGLHYTESAMAAKRESSKEDLPAQRVLRQKEIIENLRHNNEILRLDLTKESRENRRASSTGAVKDITRFVFAQMLLV
jgi:hypothetical protein